MGYAVYNILLFGKTNLESYPYLHQDLWRRLGDTAYFLGRTDVAYMHPPIPSLLYALMVNSGSYQFFIINVVFFIVGFLTVFLLAQKLFMNKAISLIAALLFFFNYSNILYSIQYGLVDMWCVILVAVGVLMFMKYLEADKIRYVLLAGVIIGISSLLQYSGLFALPLMGIALLLEKKVTLKLIVRRKQWKNLLLFIIPALFMLGFALYRHIEFGDASFSQIEHFEYFKVSFNGAVFYMWNFLAYFTVPVVILFFYGVFTAIKTRAGKRFLYPALLALPYLIFFVFCYNWRDARFLSYLAMPMALYSAYGAHTLYTKYFMKIKWLAVILFSFLLFYTNLSYAGDPGIILPGGKLIADVGAFGNLGTNGVQFKANSQPPESYFSYMINWQEKYSYDRQLNYFNVVASPYAAKELALFLKNAHPSYSCAEIQTLYSAENFVRSMQVNYYLGCKTDSKDLSFENSDFQKAFDEIGVEKRYLITDFDTVEYNLNRSRMLIYKAGPFYLYLLK